jgi:hypothetical protein
MDENTAVKLACLSAAATIYAQRSEHGSASAENQADGVVDFGMQIYRAFLKRNTPSD